MAKVNITREPGESDADFRRRYHRAWEDQDRRARGIPVKATVKGPCSVEGCDRLSEIKGMCGRHYRADRVQRMKAAGVEHRGEKQSHPLYRLWYERKIRGSLCPEWAEDFWAFADVIGEAPSPTHLLRRLTAKRPYDQGNWEWIDALKREPGETVKAFNARKWAKRRAQDPEYEIRRGLMRTYGMTGDEYRAIWERQGRVCALCKQEETQKHHKSGKVNALSVDHCHRTGVVRALLCWRCNTVIGKVKDSAELLLRMAAYVAADYPGKPIPGFVPPEESVL